MAYRLFDGEIEQGSVARAGDDTASDSIVESEDDLAIEDGATEQESCWDIGV